MTDHTVNIIISAEIAERKVELGSMAIPIDDRLDEHLYQGMQSAGKSLHQVLLQEVDDGIQEVVPETWKNVGREERQITTCLGTVQFKRRVYRDEAGKRLKPLDKILGIEKGSRYSLSVLQKGSYLASELPYREAADMLGWLIGDYISHSPFHMPEKIEKNKNRTKHVRDDGEWLQAGVPSLHLCHSNRPWAKVLKNIIHPKGVL